MTCNSDLIEDGRSQPPVLNDVLVRRRNYRPTTTHYYRTTTTLLPAPETTHTRARGGFRCSMLHRDDRVSVFDKNVGVRTRNHLSELVDAQHQSAALVSQRILVKGTLRSPRLLEPVDEHWTHALQEPQHQPIIRRLEQV